MADWKDIVIILLLIVIVAMLIWYYRMRALSGFCHCAEYGLVKVDKPLHNFWRGAPCTMSEMPQAPPGSIRDGCALNHPPPCQQYYQKPMCADLGVGVV